MDVAAAAVARVDTVESADGVPDGLPASVPRVLSTSSQSFRRIDFLPSSEPLIHGDHVQTSAWPAANRIDGTVDRRVRPAGALSIVDIVRIGWLGDQCSS